MPGKLLSVSPRRLTLALAACFTAGTALALPVGPQLVAGSAAITQAGNALTVANSPGAILHWQAFNIGANERVRFEQASASSAVLNRVLANDPSVILGQLSSNGRVWLVNPAGILIGPGARIDTAAFVASTLNIANADFLANKLKFDGLGGAGTVVNQGTITTPLGGSVYLIGSQVSNDGIIVTPKGETILAAGQTVELIDTATPGVKVEITGQDGNVTNLGRITADAGRIGIAGALIKNAGTLNASSVEREGGRIFLRATKKIELTETSKVGADGTAGGNVIAIVSQDGAISGELTANGEISVQGNGTRESGGFVETSAANLKIDDGFRVKTGGGTWLLDPDDFVIAASGGSITGSALSAALNNSSVTIQTTVANPVCTGATIVCGAGIGGYGDIYLNDAVSWTSSSRLTLNAYRNIEINRSITASHASGNLALRYGQWTVDGSNAGYTAGYRVNAPITLQAGGNFFTQLGTAGSTIAYTVITGLGVAGDATTATLQGIQNNLSGNYALGADIDASATSGWNSGAGFAPISIFTGRLDGLGHAVSNLRINPGTGALQTGLFGQTNGATLSNIGLNNVNVTGGTGYSGTGGTGALIGYSQNSNISYVYSSGTVQGTYNTGGLVGQNASGSSIAVAYSTASVSGQSVVGGLVGYATGGTVSLSYSAGTVSGTTTYQGGLVGYNMASITDSYSTASVNGGSNFIGGLVGRNEGGSIARTYASGPVTGAAGVGGLVGDHINGGSVLNSFWDQQSSGRSTSAAGSLLATTANAMTQSSFSTAGWDFTSTWWMNDSNTRPFLRSEWQSNIANSHQLQLMALNLAAGYTLAKNIDLGTPLAAAGNMWGSAGFVPVGSSASRFTGVFDGQTKTIAGLAINRSNTDIGLFGATSAAAKISNVGLTGVNITGGSASAVGAVAGHSAGQIINTYSTGTVTINAGSAGGTSADTGGLVGNNNTGGSISSSYSLADVSADGGVKFLLGGLAGVNSGSITDSFAGGSVTGSNSATGYGNTVGGLVGWAPSGSSVVRSYSTGAVTAQNNWNQDHVGGLIGGGAATISNSYSTSPINVTVSSGTTVYVGGLVGASTGSVYNSYASGSTSVSGVGSQVVGGLIGTNGGTITSSYFNKSFNAGRADDASYGKTTAELQASATFSGWSIANAGNSGATWRIYEGQTAPLLISFLKPLTVTANAATKTYDAGTYSGGNGVAYSVASPTLLGTLTYGGTSQGAINAGSYTITLSGYYSNQQGYDIRYVDGPLTINAAALGISLNGARAYDGTVNVDAGIFTLSGMVNSEMLTLSGVGTIADPNVGINKSVALGTLALGNGTGLASNYTFTGGTRMATITAAPLTVAAANATRIYGDANPALSGTITGFKNGETASILGTLPSYGTAAALTSNVGNYAIVGAGGEAQNYSFNYLDGTLAITPRPLTISVGGSKVYDRSAVLSAPTFTLGNVANNDVLTPSGTVSFADWNAGNGKALTATGLTLGGAKAGNYTWNTGASGTGSITARPLSVTGITVANKVYDGTTTASLSGAPGFSNLVGGDNVTVDSVTVTAAFLDPNAGTGKSVVLSGISLSGADAGNYTLAGAITSTTADVTRAPLTVAAANATRIYGDANPAFSGTITGFNNGETASVLGTLPSYGTAASLTSNVGNYAIVGAGGEAQNYSFNYLDGTLAITPRPLTISVGGSKVYDRSAVLSAPTFTLGNVANNDVLTPSGTVSFADWNAGNGKALTATGLTLGGAKAGNYTWNTGASGTGSITQLASVTWIGGSNGVWSDAANWFGGALPDNNNVAEVIIPATVAGSTGITITNPYALDLGNTAITANIGSFTLETVGGLTTGSGLIRTPYGRLSLITHSPMIIGSGGLQAASGITLQAVTAEAASTITLNGPVSTHTGNMMLTAYGNVTQNADISAPGVVVSSIQGNITVASSASTVAGSSGIRYLAPQGTVSSSAGNFVGATPVITSVSGTTGEFPAVPTAEVTQQLAVVLERVADTATPVVVPEPPVSSSEAPVLPGSPATGTPRLLATLGQSIGGGDGQFGNQSTGEGHTPSAAREERGPRAERSDRPERSNEKKEEKKDDKKMAKEDGNDRKKPTPRATQKKLAQCS